MRALVLRPWFLDDVKQENPRPTARGLYNGFCLPLAAGAALGFFAGAGRGRALNRNSLVKVLNKKKFAKLI